MRHQGNAVPASAVLCKCPTCGRSFGISPSDLHDQNFCSRPCYWQWHRVERPCLACGRVRRASLSAARRGAGRFCNRACFVEWNQRQATERLATRFWSRVLCVIATHCWEWQGSRRPNGYGQVSIPGRPGQPDIASRVAWRLERGPIPAGLFVCHRCDNPPCVNPAHLFLGTGAENSLDMVAKDRVSRHAAKLTRPQVEEIRQRYAAGGALQLDLAAEFGVGPKAVSKIVNRDRWR